MGIPKKIEPLSLRDPAGRLVKYEGRLLRIVRKSGAATAERLLEKPLGGKASEQLVKTRRLSSDEYRQFLDQLKTAGENPYDDVALILEHQPLTFVSYPHEWPAEMLLEAGRLTLKLASEALENGLGLKDATPANIIFEGTQPVFVDWLSFERRNPGDPTWLPFAQFLRCFVLPLLAHKKFNISLQDIFLSHRDGLEPSELFTLLGPVRKWLPPYLGLVTLPTLLSGQKKRAKQTAIYRPKFLDNPEKAHFILRSLFRYLSRQLDAVAPSSRKNSHWSNYMSFDYPYDDNQLGVKEKFMANFCAQQHPGRVLDVGCNTGYFSAIASRSGAQVVAVDLDSQVVDRVFERARRDGLNVLPLVVNLTRPSPALGWGNRECKGFLERATGAFDCVTLLAVIHHLQVGDGIPIEEIFRFISELTTRYAVVEYVGPKDDSFEFLRRGRDYSGYNQEVFERAFAPYFEVVQKVPVPNSDRCLYALVRR